MYASVEIEVETYGEEVRWINDQLGRMSSSMSSSNTWGRGMSPSITPPLSTSCELVAGSL